MHLQGQSLQWKYSAKLIYNFQKILWSRLRPIMIEILGLNHKNDKWKIEIWTLLVTPKSLCLFLQDSLLKLSLHFGKIACLIISNNFCINISNWNYHKSIYLFVCMFILKNYLRERGRERVLNAMRKTEGAWAGGRTEERGESDLPLSKDPDMQLYFRTPGSCPGLMADA